MVDQTKTKPAEEQVLSLNDCQLNVDIIKWELKNLLKSPNPFTFYMQWNKIKEKFSDFINCLTKQIVYGFRSRNDEIIVSMYKNCSYHNVWISNLKYYLKDCKYFDLLWYFKIVILFDKEKQYLAKWLLKMYNWESREKIDNYLNYIKTDNAGIKLSYTKMKTVYANLHLDEFKEKYHLEEKFNENRIEGFLEELCLKSEETKNVLLTYFSINLKHVSWFSDVYKIFSNIAWSYLWETKKAKNITEYINLSEHQTLKKLIDKEIAIYSKNKWVFYKNVTNIFEKYDNIYLEKWYFWSYIKTQIINNYYSEITKLFYWRTGTCKNRNEWASLKWNFECNPECTFAKQIEALLWLKDLIVELNKNVLWTFIRPIVYGEVAERIGISKKEFYKIRYLMTLIISNSYREYKIIHTFFDELEVFLNFDDHRLWFNKLKLNASNVLMSFLTLYFLLWYAPVWVFLSSLVLILIFVYRSIAPYKPWIKWNLWLKTFAVAMLVMSWFMWVINLEETKWDIWEIVKEVEKLWVYKTETAMIATFEALSKDGDIITETKNALWNAYTDIFGVFKKEEKK